MENASDSIVIVQHGRAVYRNPAHLKLLGYKDIDFGDGLFPGFAAPEDQPRLREYYKRRLRGEPAPEQYELELRSEDGRRVTLEVKPLIIQYRGQSAVMAIGRDITERKRQEEALQRAREELEAKVEQRLERHSPYKLTFRELTVLHLVAAGETDGQIGITLGISPLTVKKHLSNILSKMDAASRTEACVRALREGLLD